MQLVECIGIGTFIEGKCDDEKMVIVNSRT
jgi:hypothetical protein